MPRLAHRMDYMSESAAVVRGLYGKMSDPDTISFGGGAPATEGLPYDEVRQICNEMLRLESRGPEMLQYGKVLGVRELREAVADIFLAPGGVTADPDDIMIVNGGTEVMYLLAQLYIEPGDVVLVESPTYVQAVETFEMFEARVVGVECDDSGMVIEDVERKIRELHPKCVYVIPTFQNPTGKTLPTDRRRALAELGSKYDVLIIEDDPYREMRYSGEALPMIKSFDRTGHTVMSNSFSKVFSPGSRLGFMHASTEIIQRAFDAKTATNSHTSNLPQVLCAEYFKRGMYKPHLERIIEMHRERRDIFIESIDKYMPAGTKRVYPDGGLFTWVTLPGDIDTAAMLPEVNAAHVHYIAGSGFFADHSGAGRNCMRMSFGNVTPEKIEIGMKRLADIVRKHL